MNIAICDDNNTFSQQLLKNIQNLVVRNDYLSNLEIQYHCIYPPKQLLNYAKNNHIDILFLDISMPGITGLEIAETFNDRYPQTLIIFVSSFDNYVFYSFRFNPFRYIRKSNLDRELNEALVSAIKKLTLSDKCIQLISRNECFNININRIRYIEKEKASNYLIIYCINETYRHRGGISEFFNKLSTYDFIKINSGTIVNMNFIIGVSDNYVVLEDQNKLIISKNNINNIRSKYVEFLRGKD